MAILFEADLTAIYYTANAIPERFADTVRNNLLAALDGLPLISVSKQPIDFGHNIVSTYPRSHLGIYKDALLGAKAAFTKYIALCEDDVLYAEEHFRHRSTNGKFAYNLGNWSIHTWGEPLFTHKGTNRHNLHTLICERTLFIEAMEERFAKYPDDIKDTGIWAEPGKYERHLKVTQRETEEFYTNPPNLVFIHQTALGYENLGRKKRLGEFRASAIPYWGEAKEVRQLYK